MALKIVYSPLAADQVRTMREAGEAKPEKALGAQWKAVRRILVDYLPEQGLNPADRKKGDLDGIRAKHAGDRDVVVWIACAEKQTIAVLMIGFRKDGDKHDVYAVLRKELHRGTLDDQFAELEISKPGEAEPPARTIASALPDSPATGEGGEGA